METQAVRARKILIPGKQNGLRLKTRFEGILTAEKYVLIDYNIPKTALKQAENHAGHEFYHYGLEQEDWGDPFGDWKKEMYRVKDLRGGG